MSQILNYLYVGDAATANKPKELQKLGVTHVLNMAMEIPDQHKDKFIYKHIEAVDKEHYDITQHFEETNEFIHQAAQDKGVVYVHCAFGISRAPTIAMAYMIGKLKYSHTKAKHTVERKRPETYPNIAFVKQLQEYAEKLNQINKLPVQQQQQAKEESKQQFIKYSNPNTQQQQQQQQSQQQQQRQRQRMVMPMAGGVGNSSSRGQQKEIKCKACRHTLVGEKGITHQKKDVFKDKCSSIFIEQPSWIKQETLYENQQKLLCPNCKSKLGEIVLSGKNCSCGQWVAPSFQLQLKQIDICQAIQLQNQNI